MIRIDSYLAEELFLTHTHTPLVEVASGHLWYNSSSIAGKTSAAPSKIQPICQEARDSNPPLGLRHWLYANPYYLQGAHFNCSCPQPELSYSASWSEWLIRPTMWEACVQHDKMTSNDRSLNDTDGITMITTTQDSAWSPINQHHYVMFHDSTI